MTSYRHNVTLTCCIDVILTSLQRHLPAGLSLMLVLYAQRHVTSPSDVLFRFAVCFFLSFFFSVPLVGGVLRLVTFLGNVISISIVEHCPDISGTKLIGLVETMDSSKRVRGSEKLSKSFPIECDK